MARATQQYNESNIQRLKGLEAVRKKPGMYLGERGDSMVFQSLKEVIDNCVTGDTLVASDLGLRRISDFVDLQKTKGSKPYEVVVADSHGHSKTSHSGHYGVHKTLLLKTQSGHRIAGTFEHPMLSYDTATLSVGYKNLADLRTGDLVAVKLGAEVWAKRPAVGLTLNKARLLGYLVAEGYFGRMSRKTGAVSFSNNDLSVIADFVRCLEDFGSPSYVQRLDGTGCTTISITDSNFLTELIHLGVSPKWKSHSVRIPSSVLQSPRAYVVEFLRAYYEGDGSAIPGRVEAASKSARLIHELQVVLGNLGIFSKVQKTVEYFGPFYKLWVTRHKHRFMQEVGFTTTRKNSKVEQLQYSCPEYALPGITEHVNALIETARCGEKKSAWYLTEAGDKKRIRLTSRTTSGANRSEITRKQLLTENLLENITEVSSELGNKISSILQYENVVWTKIRSIRPGKTQRVFDFKVPTTRSFIANGLISSNCYDEFAAGRNKFISVYADNKTNTFVVADKAQGIPVGLVPSDPENSRSKKISTLTLIFTELHTGGKFDDKAYKTSKGTHGVGAAATNAVCSSFEVWTHRDRSWHYQQFKQGKPISDLAKVTKLPKSLLDVLTHKPVCGSIIRLTPDQAIVSKDGGKTKAKLNLQFTAGWLKSLAYLNAGLEVTFSANGKTKTFLNKAGLPQILSDKLAECDAEPLGKPFIYDSPTLSVALQWSTYPEDDGLMAYVESGLTRDGGEHEVGLRNSLNKALAPFKKKTDKFAPKDLYYGMLGVLNFRMSGAEYSGQTKDRLTSNVAPIIEQELLPELTKFFTKYKTVARLVIRRALDVKKSKEEFKKTLDAVANAKRKSKGSLPSGLVQAHRASPYTRELYIVEGDSAGGSAKKARDPKTQEVLKLTGKIANSARMKLHKLMESKAIQDILISIGYNFNSAKQEQEQSVEHKLRVNKIFLLPDSDVDGQHITVLLLTLLNKLMPELFEQGRVYIVDAPLFSAFYKNTRYFGATYAEVKGKLPRGAKVQIMRSKGWGEISYETLAVVAFNPATRTVLQVKPVRGKELKHFEALVGNDTLARKELLGL